MARRATKRRAKRLRRVHDQARRGASPFVAFDLLRLNRANLRTNPHGRMKPTGGFRRQRGARTRHVTLVSEPSRGTWRDDYAALGAVRTNWSRRRQREIGFPVRNPMQHQPSLLSASPRSRATSGRSSLRCLRRNRTILQMKFFRFAQLNVKEIRPSSVVLCYSRVREKESFPSEAKHDPRP